jgi:hypothetical protein
MVINVSALYENGLFDKTVVRMTADDVESARLLFVSDGVVAKLVKTGGNVFDTRDSGPYFLIIGIDKFNAAACLQSPEGLAGLSIVDPDTVGGDAFEFMVDAVLDALASPQQQDEHENAPGYTEAGEKGSQPVGAYGGENFLEKV